MPCLSADGRDKPDVSGIGAVPRSGIARCATLVRIKSPACQQAGVAAGTDYSCASTPMQVSGAEWNC